MGYFVKEEHKLITNVLLPGICLGVLQETEGSECFMKRKKATRPRSILSGKVPGQLAEGTLEGVCQLR